MDPLKKKALKCLLDLERIHELRLQPVLVILLQDHTLTDDHVRDINVSVLKYY